MSAYEFTATAEGRPAFRKYQSSGDSRRFHAEAEGLRALAASGAVRVPEVLRVSETELLTERIQAGSGGTEGWQRLGEQLAALQAVEQPCFGFVADNFCGDTPQPNPHSADGHAFFAEHRLGFQGNLAFNAGLLNAAEMAELDSVCKRLESLVPAQSPALLHGDLWNGNVLFDADGQPVLIDPACYWGWPEAEIAMCALFGGFAPAFYESWAEHARPEPGWRERLPIYQLYHLLNHLNLFGMSYHRQVAQLLRRFG